MKNKKLTQLMQDLNTEELVQAVYPFSNHYKIIHACFVKKGLSEWPTWFILIDSGFTDIHGYLLLTVCGHSDISGLKLIRNLNLEDYIEQLETKSSSIDNFELLWWHQNLGELGKLSVNEAYRLYEYLEVEGIKLFEPTE